MEQMQMNKPDIYDAALYLRLSKDDVEEGGAKSESNSIANQRELLRSFVKSQPDIQIFDIYVDDGYSGGNFDRPEFKRMTTDIEAGKVNCVIVKDLSRFGREYIEAGRWIEKTYPALNVRFISVTDQFDSKTADFSEKSFVVPIKNFVNESYCRDISGKVRSHQKIKREKGEFIGAFAPYGYCKDPENKNCLVIDSYAADIVRKIFSWKIDGFSLGAIAEKLNVRYVQSPKEYKKANGENYNSGFHSSDTPKWSAVQIKRILTNEVYIGNMVQGKQERISYKVKQRLDKPESEWVKVENTHPAIIRQSDFDVVQKLLQYDGRASKTLDSANFFSGFVFCGDCKTSMIRRVNQYKGKKKAFYICQTKNKGGDCTRHSIPEEVLKRIVLSMNIKNLVNDAYAKDISAKERAAKRIAQKNGEYVGSTAPYGYCVEKINGICKLIVEPEAAKIVRRIFEEYASGDGIQSIIDRLFEDRVHRISDYNQYHHVYCQDGENLHQWGNSSIRAVLNRNNYYGDLVQRKYESRFQRGEKWCDILDQSQWIITPNAHEPIISRELFDKAQVRLKVAQQKATKTTVGWEEDERAFYNVLYCGDCKRKMCTRRYRGNVYYFCNAAWYRDERKCSHKSISEEKLQKIVRSELTRQFQLSGLRKKDMSVISSAVFLSKINEIQTEIRKLDADMERRSEKLAQAFMQYKEGELSKEAYIEMKDDRNNWKEFCEERKKSLEQTIRKLEKQQKEEARFLRSLLELDGTTRINAELAESLIESMYLYGDNRLEINFGFKGAVEHE